MQSTIVDSGQAWTRHCRRRILRTTTCSLIFPVLSLTTSRVHFSSSSYTHTHTHVRFDFYAYVGPDDEDATIVPDGVTLEPGEYMVLCEDVHFPFGIGTYGCSSSSASSYLCSYANTRTSSSSCHLVCHS